MKTIVWTTQAVCFLALVVLSGCASAIAPSTASTVDINQDQATIQALQKRLQGRERTVARQHYQIEVMSSQLEALKRIDQDVRASRLPRPKSVAVAP